MTPSQDLVDLAQRLADASGAVIRRYFRKGIEADDKEDTSPVTIADREAEAVMRDLLAAHAPGHGIVGEELGRADEGAELVWVLDPIDGTKAFLTGKPLFGTLIALLHGGVPVLGIIDQPVLGDRWLGALGRPTLWNGAPARVRACAGLSQARLSTTGPQYFPPAEARAFEAVAARAKLLSYGGDCYQYGLVASGCVDVVVEHGLKLHDFAALVPVITGAGGVMTDWDGRPLGAASAGDVVAAGDPRTHAEVLAALRAGHPARGAR
ncbi:histidinol-phosphate phosphatase [Sorangium cellulosum]|uniref:Histidinol-phosphatase n=1 Tax=Sorangium cellulosum TaxID=56 RepID=A0A4P2QEA9_SORCE|nr:histidinol-phosphatase [Sorangium cellulosum]AUX27771.1 histidinol-phosphate phosphatase [Sorangium cellulosum]